MRQSTIVKLMEPFKLKYNTNYSNGIKKKSKLTLVTVKRYITSLIAKDVFLYYKRLFLFFKLYWRNKGFCRSLKAISYTFPRTNNHLLKLIFQNIQKVIVQQDLSLQS